MRINFLKSSPFVKIEAGAYFLLSFFILLLAQPDFSIFFSILASAVGYAFAFKALLSLATRGQRFWTATLFFAFIQAVHLSWFTADEYVGIYIYPVLFLLSLGLGLQFGFLSLFMVSDERMGWSRLFMICSLWTFLEWSRLFLLSGYPFNPVGLALSATLYGMQLVSIFGLFGLSFWVMMTNLLFYRRSYRLFITALLIPYLYGVAAVSYHDWKREREKGKEYSVVLVQTGLKPEQKVVFNNTKGTPLSPVEQWEHIFSLVAPFMGLPLDLVLLSEGQVPYGTNNCFYPRNLVEKSMEKFFEDRQILHNTKSERVSNSFWAQSLSNTLGADVIIGMEDGEYKFDKEAPDVYNAAFVYSPFVEAPNRYAKRVLVPMGEYIPFTWCKKILSRYGISDSYTKGESAVVVKTDRASYGLSICYEEAFGHLMRENRLNKANLLVNLTNDIWYPRSRLPYVHYMHGRLRAVEGGMPLVRSCNSGVTCALDSVGRCLKILDFESSKSALVSSSCHVLVPSYCYFTIYTHLGDGLILLISSVFILFYFLSIIKISLLHKKVKSD